MESAPGQITQLLMRARDGNDSAREDLVRVTYDHLRRIAQGYFAKERRNHTLQATALVHELQLRLLRNGELPGASRDQFFAFAAKAMRHLLVDYARTRDREKRGGGGARQPLDELMLVGAGTNLDVLALDEALERLSKLDERKGRVVELKFFAGLTGEQIAQVLEVSPATVDRDWEVARRWLYEQLAEESDDRPNGTAS